MGWSRFFFRPGAKTQTWTNALRISLFPKNALPFSPKGKRIRNMTVPSQYNLSRIPIFRPEAHLSCPVGVNARLIHPFTRGGGKQNGGGSTHDGARRVYVTPACGVYTHGGTKNRKNALSSLVSEIIDLKDFRSGQKKMLSINCLYLEKLPTYRYEIKDTYRTRHAESFLLDKLFRKRSNKRSNKVKTFNELIINKKKTIIHRGLKLRTLVDHGKTYNFDLEPFPWKVKLKVKKGQLENNVINHSS